MQRKVTNKSVSKKRPIQKGKNKGSISKSIQNNKDERQLRQVNNRTVEAAAAYATGFKYKAPSIQYTTKVSCRIVHRELVASLTSNTVFALNFILNAQPGLGQSFPWLSILAQAFEQYRFHRLALRYYTRTGSSTAGSVIIAPDYDASDVQPLTEQIAASYADSTEDAPWKDMLCELKPDRLHPQGVPKFIRTSNLVASQDVKLYDGANIWVYTTDGTAAGNPWGKLFVEYDVEFFVPTSPSIADPPLFQHIRCNGPTTANFLGGTQTQQSGSSNIFTFVNNVMTCAIGGVYFLVYSGNATTITAVTVAFGGGAFYYANLGPTYATPVGYQVAGSATNVATFYTAVETPVGSTITFNWTYTTGTFAELEIIPIPQNFNLIGSKRNDLVTFGELFRKDEPLPLTIMSSSPSDSDREEFRNLKKRLSAECSKIADLQKLLSEQSI
jgi:hypothetical protein